MYEYARAKWVIFSLYSSFKPVDSKRRIECSLILKLHQQQHIKRNEEKNMNNKNLTSSRTYSNFATPCCDRLRHDQKKLESSGFFVVFTHSFATFRRSKKGKAITIIVIMHHTSDTKLSLRRQANNSRTIGDEVIARNCSCCFLLLLLLLLVRVPPVKQNLEKERTNERKSQVLLK